MHLLPAKTSKPHSGGIGFPTHTVPKICACGARWDGQTFKAPAADAPPMPGKCPACLAKDEARTRELMTPVVSATAVPELARPRRASDGLDD